jgi:hypothetical protein
VFERNIWLNHLGVEEGTDECDTILKKDRPRVWIGHFHEVDIIIVPDELHFVSCLGVDLS